MNNVYASFNSLYGILLKYQKRKKADFQLSIPFMGYFFKKNFFPLEDIILSIPFMGYKNNNFDGYTKIIHFQFPLWDTENQLELTII